MLLQRYTIFSLLVLFVGLGAGLCFGGSGQQAHAKQSFSGIYEPSGLIHLGEGEFILIEDEAAHPFHLVRLKSNGSLEEAGQISQSGPKIKLIDLEGIAFDGHFVYAITSHSINKKGKAPRGRSILIRYQYQQGELEVSGVIKDLKGPIISLLKQTYPGFTEVQLNNQLNIEALSWSADSQSLYLGLRAPVINGQSLIIQITRPSDMFERESAAAFNAQIIELKLGGVGIRAMSWDEWLDRFVLITGDKKKGDGQFTAWSWNGGEEIVAEKLWVTDKGTEGLAQFEIPGLKGWVSLKDDGKRKKAKPAHYWVNGAN